MASKRASKSSSKRSTKSGSKKCAPGYIKRAAYKKKGFERKSYTRTTPSGKTVNVKGTHVARSYVGPACTPAKGKAIQRGKKTPESEKILPPIREEIQLKKQYGYSTKDTPAKRHKVLKEAMEDFGGLKILQHLNLISNYSADKKAKATLKDDVKYVSKKRAQVAKKEGRRVRSKFYEAFSDEGTTGRTARQRLKSKKSTSKRGGSRSRNRTRTRSRTRSRSRTRTRSVTRKRTGGKHGRSRTVTRKRKSGSKSSGRRHRK